MSRHVFAVCLITAALLPGSSARACIIRPAASMVATARRGQAWLGVVLLHSGDTSTQAQQLLNAGFAKAHQSRTTRNPPA